MELHRAGKEYLKTILVLEQQSGTVRSLDVAKALNVTKPSVSKAMKRLCEGGYLTMDGSLRHSASLGQALTHSMQRMHSVPLARFLELSVTSTSMGHTRLHLPQEMHLLLSQRTRSREK